MPEQIPFPVLHVHLGPSPEDDSSLAELAGDLRRVEEVRQSAVVAGGAPGPRLERPIPGGRTRRVAAAGRLLPLPGPGLRALAAVGRALAELTEPLPPAGEAGVDAAAAPPVPGSEGDGRDATAGRGATPPGLTGDPEVSGNRDRADAPAGVGPADRADASEGGEPGGRAVQWPVPERWPVVHAHGAPALRAVWIAAAWRGSSARVLASPLTGGDGAPAGLWRRADLVAVPDSSRWEVLHRRGVERRRLRALRPGDGAAALDLYRRLASGERRRVARVDWSPAGPGRRPGRGASP